MNSKAALDAECSEAGRKNRENHIKGKTGQDVKVSCEETCKTDGCNGSSQYGPVAMMIAIPIIILKLLSL